MKFYLGTNEPRWLERTSEPLFISRRRMGRLGNRLPRAACSWALDSGGFSELLLFGGWRTSPRAYAAEVRRYGEDVGGLDWAAAQDWICDPLVRKKTGLSVRKHQELTIDSFVELMSLDPDLPFVPVLQGHEPSNYWRHLEMYVRRKVDLAALPLIGVGGVYSRQATSEVEGLIRGLKNVGLSLHGFGFKKRGLARIADALSSADSLAWSYQARRNGPLRECRHGSCNSCLRYALSWRDDLLTKIRRAFPMGARAGGMT